MARLPPAFSAALPFTEHRRPLSVIAVGDACTTQKGRGTSVSIAGLASQEESTGLVINESIAVFNAIGTHMAWTAVRQPRPECTATALVIRAGGAEALVFLMIQR
jgi:hypothetical protein